jgi:hypothetical protein
VRWRTGPGTRLRRSPFDGLRAGVRDDRLSARVRRQDRRAEVVGVDPLQFGRAAARDAKRDGERGVATGAIRPIRPIRPILSLSKDCANLGQGPDIFGAQVAHTARAIFPHDPVVEVVNEQPRVARPGRG